MATVPTVNGAKEFSRTILLVEKTKKRGHECYQSADDA